MVEEKRIHIMSAGEHVHSTFPIANNKISHANKLYVIVEEEVYNNSTDERTQSTRKAIRDSIDELKK